MDALIAPSATLLSIPELTRNGCGLIPAPPANTVGNNLQAGNNYAALSIDDNKVGGNLQVNNDTAATDVSGNTVAHNLQCQNNSPAVTYVALNTVLQGLVQGQCAAFP